MSSPWRRRDLRLYLAGRFAWSLAVMMQSVAVGWQVYAMTKDPVALGWVGLVQFLPMLALTVPAGDLADRFDRRYLVAFAAALQAITSALLLTFSLTGQTALAPVLATLALFGVGRAIGAPASRSFVPSLVPDDELPAASAMASSTFHVAVIVGPALGGLLYGLGPSVVYGSAASLSLVTLISFASMRTQPTPPPASGTAWSRVIEGVRFLRGSPIVLGAVSLDLFAVLLGGATALLPVFAADVLHVGAFGLGALRSAPALGALGLSAWLLRAPPTRRVGWWMFAGVAIFGLATIGFGLSRSFWLSFVMLLIMGAADMISVWVRSTLIPLATPRGMLGRVSAVEMLFIGASNELGEFESGMTAGWFGTVPAVLVGGVGTLVVTAAWAVGFPALRQVDRFDEVKPPER